MSRFAWVTLATNDSYALGGLVLANSLKRVSTAHQLVILVTPTISESMRHKLSGVFDLVQEVNVLDSQDTANLALLKRPELGITFTKLHCWRLTQFEKCVFLDADTLVLQNSDELFDREELSAAPDVGWPDCFNTGVFVYRPSLDTYGKIMEFAVTKGSFDGGDQGLLNLYFSDWATKDISKHLPFAYNTASTATYSYLPAFKQFGANTKILHFIGAVKPWLQNFDSQSQQVQTPAGYQHLTGFLQDWWNIFCESVHPNLDTTMQYQMRDHGDTFWKQVFQIPKSNSYSYTQSTHNPHNGSVCCDNGHHNDTSPQEIVFYDPWEEFLSRQDESIGNRIDSENLEIFQALEQLPEPVVSAPEVADEQPEPEQPVPHIEEPAPEYSPTHGDVVNSSLDHVELCVHCNCNSVHCNCNGDVVVESPSIPTVVAPEAMNHVPFIETNVTNNVETMNEHEQEVNSASSKCKETELKTSEEEQGIVGALAQLKLGAPRTPEQIAYEDMMRRQSWESGQIDFAGRDAFANIWARIEQTISTNPTVEEAAAPAPIVPVMQKTPEGN